MSDVKTRAKRAKRYPYQHVPGVSDPCIVERFIAGETVAELAKDFDADAQLVESAIRAWAQPYWYLDLAADELLDRWLP